MPDPRRRLFSPTFRSVTPDDVEVDHGAFIERLLIFDTYVLHSRNLLEIPHLVRQFGIEAVSRAFRSGALELSVDKSTIGVMTPREGPVDPYVVHLEGIRLTQPASMEHDFAHLNRSLEVRRVSDRRSLFTALRGAIEATPFKYSTADQAGEELMSDFNSAATASTRMDPFVRAALQRQGIDDANRDLRFRVTRDGQAFGVDTDLEDVFGLDSERAGLIVRGAFLALATEVSRTQEMRLYQALTPFADADAPLFGSHLEYVIRQAHPDTPTLAFNRAVTVKGLPNLRSPGVAESVNLHQLLEARSSPEAVAFRQWLWSAADLTDLEIAEQLEYHVDTVGRRFRQFLGSPRGRALRWVVTTGAGIGLGIVDPLAGGVAGTAVGYGDSFLLDKIIPRDNERSLPAAFLARTYPSLFES